MGGALTLLGSATEEEASEMEIKEAHILVMSSRNMNKNWKVAFDATLVAGVLSGVLVCNFDRKD